MSGEVRYRRIDDGTYCVHDAKSGRWLGDVFHDTDAREWYAYAREVFRLSMFVGTARTRREATDLILGAS